MAVQFPLVWWSLPANAEGAEVEPVARTDPVSLIRLKAEVFIQGRTISSGVSGPVAMQEVQAGDSTSIWGPWAALYAKCSDGVGIPGAEVPPQLEQLESLG